MKILRKLWEEEWIAEQGDGSDSVQSNDCISIFPNIGSASILGPYPSVNLEVEPRGLDDRYDMKICPADDGHKDSADNQVNEGTCHSSSSIETAERHVDYLVCAKTIDDHVNVLACLQGFKVLEFTKSTVSIILIFFVG